MKKIHTREAVKERGEIFTPPQLVNDMLDKLPQELFTENKTFLDNSCGDGAFLFNVLQRKMSNGIPYIEALKSIYGCELDKANTLECKKRLMLAGKPTKEAQTIINRNIINADALDENHPGWKKVGFYWSKLDK